MSPLEITAILLLALFAMIMTQVSIIYIYHYYFLVPLFKLMSYQSGVDIPPSFDASLNPPTARKTSTRSPVLNGNAVRDMMDKLNNAF
jgi:hypothetical protein